MKDAVRPLRRAAKLLAIAATLWGAFAALVAAIASVDGACRTEALEVAINAVPVAQLLLLKAGIDRDRSAPGAATMFYALAILALLPQSGAAAICWA